MDFQLKKFPWGQPDLIGTFYDQQLRLEQARKRQLEIKKNETLLGALRKVHESLSMVLEQDACSNKGGGSDDFYIQMDQACNDMITFLVEVSQQKDLPELVASITPILTSIVQRLREILEKYYQQGLDEHTAVNTLKLLGSTKQIFDSVEILPIEFRQIVSVLQYNLTAEWVAAYRSNVE